MRLACNHCGARSKELPDLSFFEWKCASCMKVQVFEEEFIDGIVEFKQEFELGEENAKIE